MKRTKASKKHIELFCKAWNEGFNPPFKLEEPTQPKTKDHEKTKKQD